MRFAILLLLIFGMLMLAFQAPTAINKPIQQYNFPTSVPRALQGTALEYG